MQKILYIVYCCDLELNDHVEQMVSLICKAHGLPDPSSLATVSLVSGIFKCVCILTTDVFRNKKFP